MEAPIQTFQGYSFIDAHITVLQAELVHITTILCSHEKELYARPEAVKTGPGEAGLRSQWLGQAVDESWQPYVTQESRNWDEYDRGEANNEYSAIFAFQNW